MKEKQNCNKVIYGQVYVYSKENRCISVKNVSTDLIKKA